MSKSSPSSAQTYSPLDVVGTTVHTLISGLQRGALDDRPDAVAALARLRRAAGRDPLAEPDLWGLVDISPLYEQAEQESLHERDLVRAESAAYMALTLWAAHQQSRAAGMHQRDRKEAPTTLGAAVRRLMPLNEIDEPLRKRFVRAGTAPDLPTLARRLRELVVLLRREDVPLDYGLLTQELVRWQQPGGRDAVRRSWGRSFHAYRPRGTKPADPTETTGTAAAADTADKDAS